MSENTDKETNENTEILTEFYHDRILPLAEKARERGVEFFPFGADAAADSYFIDRADDGDYVHSIDVVSLEKELSEMWKTEELPDIIGLAEPITEMARTLHQKEPVTDEVSPFIYAMF